MEPQNIKIIGNFISESEKSKILDWIDSLICVDGDSNHHIKTLSTSLKGKSFIFNQSKTSITDYITKFQSVSQVSSETPPDFILEIQSRIVEITGFPTDNIFFQAVDMSKGGFIGDHYDATVKGYINYKCNISVLSEDYDFYIDRVPLGIREKDLYGFEASLYRHSTDPFTSRRVFLSFGFLIPYSVMGRTESDPRVRLSQRIEKYFQQNI